ncbi:RICIN domain-containing protein (plasmid) [Streptomyces scopuliridis]|uniref:RICIN domain-containing protein n=1 Tax=Streptomyces scopuliridis TaxID=452529 RepID=UPI002DD7F1B1|nr:RICIN domain-containing protein [Streptomyces scopuliridis]WSB39248.1 RICIN domain-containing protein [Streptomyces scopuliridis]
MSEIDQDETKRRQRARFVDALTTSAQQPGERSRMGTRVAGAVAVLALAAGATLGVGAWRSYQADEEAQKVELAAEQAAAHKKLTRSPSPSPEPKVTKKETVTEPGTSVERRVPEPVVTPSASPTKKQTETRAETRAEDVAKAELRKLTAVSRTLLLKNVFTGLCADIPFYTAGTKGEDVNQYYCDGTDKDNQLWRMTSPRPGAGPGGTDLVQFANLKDGLCMDLPTRGGQPSGTGLLEAHCTGTMGDNQLWWFEPAGDGSVMIRNYASNHLCLKVDGLGAEKKKPDQRLVIGPCGSRDDSRWRLIE